MSEAPEHPPAWHWVQKKKDAPQGDTVESMKVGGVSLCVNLNAVHIDLDGKPWLDPSATSRMGGAEGSYLIVRRTVAGYEITEVEPRNHKWPEGKGNYSEPGMIPVRFAAGLRPSS